MSSPLGLRLFRTSQRAAARFPIRSKPAGQRRFQSTEVPPHSAQQSTQSTFQRLWNSPVGVKTVHFWCVFDFLLSCGGGRNARYFDALRVFVYEKQ